MTIARIDVETLWCDASVYNGIAFLAGQVGTSGASVTQQTQEILDQIDALLARVGSDRSKLLQATIWLADMRDTEEMNKVWAAWLPKGTAPARCCGGLQLHDSGTKVEIIVTAAVDK